MNSTCAGCENLKFEVFPNGRRAARCFAPLPAPWGNGRVVGNPVPKYADFMLNYIERPVWCRKEQE